ncbi:MAG: hypothetical protein FJ137_03680 [Deltaproteobacteria bacterium]|nr:hypothetical protein [Deltaproteobacteria bacterium]
MSGPVAPSPRRRRRRPAATGAAPASPADPPARRLNDLNPYSLNAEGWCDPTDSRVQRYDRAGPPADVRADPARRTGRSALAAQIEALAQQSARGVAWEALWDRWQQHPRLPVVGALFPRIDDAGSKTALRAEASAFVVRTAGNGGRPLSARLARSGLSAEAAGVVLDLLVELRHAWKHRAGNVADAGYDDLNWRHTCGELAQLLDLAAEVRLQPQQVVDAALVSLLSDAAKLRGNFLTHHIDGAIAAVAVLPRVLPVQAPRDRQRIVGLCQAILEHQVGPPRFMATMVRLAIAGALRKLGLEGGAAYTILDGLAARIADPMNPAHVERHAEGYGVLRVSRDERSLLKLVDLHDWYVPHPLTPWFAASSLVIDADSLVNYVTADGVGKIVAICGPGTPFCDQTVFHSIFSCGASFVDAVSVMSDAAMASVERGLATTRERIDKVRAGMARELGRGLIAFPRDTFEHIAGEEGVDVTQLKVRRLRGLTVVQTGYAIEALPYWSAPLDYATDGHDARIARLIRRKVADLLRAV